MWVLHDSREKIIRSQGRAVHKPVDLDVVDTSLQRRALFREICRPRAHNFRVLPAG